MFKRPKILSPLLGCALCLAPTVFAQLDAKDWKGIAIDVAADHPVTIGHRLVPAADGFQRLEISLTNDGAETLTIDSIEVSVPLAMSLSDEMEMLYGSSCMGRRPLLRHAVGEQGRRSYSYMYGMIQLSEDAYVLAGSLSWRTFLPVFSLEGNTFQIRSEGEGKQLRPGESVPYERIVLRIASDWQTLLESLGQAIAVENGIGELKDVEFKGWATWDYYGRIFTVDDILGNLREMKALYPAANLIQIDGGWWTERGDYMSIRDDLPGGIKALADRINAQGMTAGLHFDGFRGDQASEIYRTHPEYFLHDQDGEVIVETKALADREMNYIYFDYSHPGARAHIARCVEAMKEWGIRYFKVDFMRYGLESEVREAHPDVKKIIAHDPSLTGVERFRLGMKTIREAIGEENYFLGCSAVFGPTIGFVDGMRTGGDIHPRYEAFPERSLANTGNFYLAGTVYHGDCDYLVFREAADEDETIFKSNHKYGGSLSLNEARTWADYNKLFGNARLHSDNLMSLRPERKALVKEVMEWPAMDETVPLDVWQHATDKMDGFERLLARQGDDIYLGIFNWGDGAKAYDLSAFGEKAPLRLDGRHSKIVKYKGSKSFAELCRELRM